METKHAAVRAKAGAASGAARRARVIERDRGMALSQARYPGLWSYSALGREHGMTRAGVRAAILRAKRDPAIAAECEVVDVSLRSKMQALQAAFTLSPKDRLLAALAEAGDNCTCGLRQAVSDFLKG